MANAIEIQGVTKTFGQKVAVDRLDLQVPQGAIYGLIGPNGAGKTTSIRMVMSILFPDSGSISVLGHNSAIESKDQIGYLPEERGIYKKMKVGAFLKHIAYLKGRHSRGLDNEIKQWLERLDLAEVYKKKCEELSKGMQQKIQFLSTILHNPDLLILDEPFSGLDPVNMRLLRDLIREQHKAGKTVIFSTHVMHQAEELCDHIVMINQGRKVLDSTLSEIRTQFDPHTIVYEPADSTQSMDPIRGLPGIRSVSQAQASVEVSLIEGVVPAEVLKNIVATIPVRNIAVRRPTLEDVFIDIVQKGKSGDDSSLRASLRGEPVPAGGAT